jgi:hypothetical protein
MAQKVSQSIPMPELDKEGKQCMLECVTYRPHEGGVYSSVRVHFLEGQWKTTELFGDFHCRLEYNKGLRATQKNVDNQHARLFTPQAVEIFKNQVRAFYAHKRAAA